MVNFIMFTNKHAARERKEFQSMNVKVTVSFAFQVHVKDHRDYTAFSTIIFFI